MGGAKEAEDLVFGLFGQLGIELRGSPDFLSLKTDSFGIDDARKLNDWALRKAFGAKKVALISPERLTPEAQNALLKTLEEPGEGTHFFINVREASTILPTLRSRLMVESLEQDEMSGEAKKFLKMSLKERLNYAKKFAEKELNLSHFLDELLLAMRELNHTKLPEVYKMREVSDQRGSASRLVLEHLALLI